MQSIYCGVDKWLSRRPHKSEIEGSSPSPARDTNNQPPRGVSWVMLMIKNFWVLLCNFATKNSIYNGGIEMTKIYKITNLINEKSYVGKTSFSLEKRFQEHCRDALKNDKEHRPLYSAFNKYGVENFNIELIEECEDDVSSLREQYWIGYYQTYSNGYNATLGGEGIIKYNHDKIIQALKTNPYPKEVAEQFGCCVEIVRDIAKSNNIEIRNKGQEDFLKTSVEILQFDKQGKFLNKFQSCAEAARWCYENKHCAALSSGVRSHIGEAAKGKRKSAYGFVWKIVE